MSYEGKMLEDFAMPTRKEIEQAVIEVYDYKCSLLRITPVNGCCYGRDNSPDKGDYFKYYG